MDFGYLKLLVALALAERLWSFPLGCEEKGTSYREGEVVEVGEPCLSCVCRRGALACSLRVCADYVEPLPQGCFLVHRANDCCPRLLCEAGHSPKGIEVRRAVGTEEKAEGNGCVVNGTAYGEGSAVASRDRCEYCYCTEGGVKCVKPRCADSLEGCKAVYEKYSCCPTHFDCRDADVGFLASRVKHFANVNGKTPKNAFKSLSEHEEDDSLQGSLTDRSSTPAEEPTTEDFQVATTTAEEFGTEEGTTSDGLPPTTTPSPPDYSTTLGLQTTTEEYSTVESGGGTTAVVTTSASPRNEEASEGGNGESSGSRWNSSEAAEDYDAYDYGEPKLPPSLPNLVIFPFVAADAVVKDDRDELHEEVQLERTDDQPVIFKDYFSPPSRTEGGFVPKQPPSEPFYEFPFLTKELTEQSTDPPPEGNPTAPQINFPPQTSNANSSRSAAGVTFAGVTIAPFDANQRPDSEDFLSDDSRRSQFQPGPFSQVPQTEMAEFFLKSKSQQTKKPVTVAYKNVVVDFYPDHLVTTTRSHSTKSQASVLNATDASHQLRQRYPAAPVLLNVLPHSVLGSTSSAPPKATRETAPEEPSTATPAAAPEGSSVFDLFLMSLTESSGPTPSNRHKYSSKIKSRLSTTAKPQREDGVASAHPPTHSQPSASVATGSGSSSAREGLRHSPTTTSPILKGMQSPPLPQLPALRGHLSGDGPPGSLEGGPSKPHSNPGTLLKLAGCNIYGMMYRIGKVITELSGPCVECLCTDLGVQCSPLQC